MPCMRLCHTSCQIRVRRIARPTWRTPSRLDGRQCFAFQSNRSPTSNNFQSQEKPPPRTVGRVPRVEKEESPFRSSQNPSWKQDSGGESSQQDVGRQGAVQGRQGGERGRQKYNERASRDASWSQDAGRQTGRDLSRSQDGGRQTGRDLSWSQDRGRQMGRDPSWSQDGGRQTARGGAWRGGQGQGRRGEARGGGRQRGAFRRDNEAPWQRNEQEPGTHAEVWDTETQRGQPGFQTRNPRQQSGQDPSQQEANNWWSRQQNATPSDASNQRGYRGQRRPGGRYSPRDSSSGRGPGEKPWQGYDPRTDARQAVGQQRKGLGPQNPSPASSQIFDDIWELGEESGESDVSEETQEVVNQRRRQTGLEAGTRESGREPAEEGVAWGRQAQARSASSAPWQAAGGTAAVVAEPRGERPVDYECKRTNFKLEDLYMVFCRDAFRKKVGPPERQILAMQDFLDELTLIVDRSGPRFDAINTATALHRLAKAVSDERLDPEFQSKFRYEALTGKLLMLVESQVTEFRFQAVANIMWAVAKLGNAGMEDTLDRLNAHALYLLEAPTGRVAFRDLAQLVWALAKMGRCVSPNLLEGVARAALSQLHAASPYDVSMLLWGFAKLSTLPQQVFWNPADGQLLDASVTQLTWILPKMVEQDLSNTLWALGTLGHHQLSPASLSELSSTWAAAAYAQLGGPDLEVLSREQSQHLANMVWAYAQLRILPGEGELLSLALTHVTKRPADFSLNELSMVVWAAAVLRFPLPEGAASKLVAHFGARCFRPDPQAVTNMCWAFAVLGELTVDSLTSLASSLTQNLGDPNSSVQFEARHATQLLRADEAVCGPRAVIGQNFSTRVSCLPHGLEMQARQLVYSDAPDGTLPSPLLDSVSRALEEIGIPHTLSWRTPDALLAVDIFVPRPAPLAPVALLVDGPWHFRALPPYETLGRTVLRNRLLAARGYSVSVIPWFDWVAAEAVGQEALFDFLRERLGVAGLVLA